MNTKNAMIITLLLILSNYLFGQENTKSHYKTLTTLENVEVREYKESMNISYHDSYSENYFQYLANYIFGGNNEKEKISMTSPVTMRQYGNQEMIFRPPTKFLKEKAPKPDNNKIKIFKIEPKIKGKYLAREGSYPTKFKKFFKIKLNNFGLCQSDSLCLDNVSFNVKFGSAT